MHGGDKAQNKCSLKEGQGGRGGEARRVEGRVREQEDKSHLEPTGITKSFQGPRRSKAGGNQNGKR